MRLKRHHLHDESAEPGEDGKRPLILDPDTRRPKLDYIEVEHTGSTREQHFSVDLVAAGLAEGWISIKAGKLTLHVRPEELVYTILRVPGKYPSKAERSGYEVIHYYDCVLDEAQHARYCAKTERQRREDLALARGLKPKVKGVRLG